MTSSLIFYTNPMSRGRMVRWMLEETGQPYEVELLEYGPAMKSEAYLAINPMGKVPALRHGETVITETVAICTYLADAFPQTELAPPVGAPLRGPYYRWLFFLSSCLEPAMIYRALNVEVPEDKRGMVGFGDLEATVTILEQALAGSDNLVGDRFSTADLLLSSFLGWAMQGKLVTLNDRMFDYVKLHSNRPAALRARAIDDGLLDAG